MSYEENIGGFSTGFTGSQEFPVNNLAAIQFSQIFNGTPQLYAGSSFTVEEVVEIGVLINNPRAIDVDFRWYPPKKYMGTWTLFDQVSSFGTYPEDRGFLEDFSTKIRRYSTYVIQANADIPIAVHEQSAIDDCNFNLVSVEVGVPPLQIQGSGLFTPIAVLKSRNTLTKVPLLNRPFIGRIKTIGLYIDPGCELTFINYKARVINGISVDLPNFPLTPCNVAPPSNCDSAYQAWLLTPPPPLAVGGVRYATVAAAEAARAALTVPNAYLVVNSSFTCQQAPGTVYPAYIVILQDV